jgi:sec-independent protein translocase protein TatC
VVFPFGFPVMLSVSGENVKAVLSIDKYLTFSTTIMLAFGLSFQLPVVVWVLARLGLIDHIDMLRGFRYSIVAIFVVAAVLTPPDWFDQVLMAIPLVLLYILGIGVAWMSTTKKREVEEASSTAEG